MGRRTKAVLATGVLALGTGLALGAAPLAAKSSANVNVSLREFRIVGIKAPAGQAAKGIASGATTFRIRNTGQFPHNLVVFQLTPKGVLKRVAGIAPIEKGTRTTLDVNLKPGAYLAVCTVFNGYHLSQGMSTRFTVGSGVDFDTGAWAP